LCRVVCTVYSDEERVSDLSVASGRPTSPVASLSAALSRRQTVHFQRVSPVLQIQHVFLLSPHLKKNLTCIDLCSEWFFKNIFSREVELPFENVKNNARQKRLWPQV
jgi:hypothetical protein